jgi:hypothetical protein
VESQKWIRHDDADGDDIGDEDERSSMHEIIFDAIYVKRGEALMDDTDDNQMLNAVHDANDVNAIVTQMTTGTGAVRDDMAKSNKESRLIPTNDESKGDHTTFTQKNGKNKAPNHNVGNKSLYHFHPEGDESPDRLLQNDDNAVRILRIGFLLVLVISALAFAVFLFWFLRRNETRTCCYEYDALARSLLESLYDAPIRQLWMCRNIANLISVAIVQQSFYRSRYSIDDNPYYLEATASHIDMSQWSTLTQQANLEAGQRLLSYSQ